MTGPAGLGERPMPAQRVGEVFVVLADTLAEDFEVTGVSGRLAGHCLELTDADGAGVIGAGADGDPELIASTDVTSRPGRRRAAPASFRPVRADRRLPGAHAVPMRHGAQVIGVLNLFRRDHGPLSPRGRQMARAMADGTATVRGTGRRPPGGAAALRAESRPGGDRPSPAG
ncbi:hypothetical protein [Actinoplanes sp. NPDC048796]|uniref:hypothetical protein n=1 Tax=Actinoplanes sp. NPDC048796 TaxID=3155640 RepID=UPI0033E2EE75